MGRQEGSVCLGGSVLRCSSSHVLNVCGRDECECLLCFSLCACLECVCYISGVEARVFITRTACLLLVLRVYC